ncbi:MAG: hypothetical protein R3E95_22335 [Thiolinea sp.]
MANLQVLGEQLKDVLSQPWVEAALLPQLQTISSNLRELQGSVDKVTRMREQDALTDQLALIASGIQGMGTELAEVAASSKETELVDRHQGQRAIGVFTIGNLFSLP